MFLHFRDTFETSLSIYKLIFHAHTQCMRQEHRTEQAQKRQR